MAKTIEQFKGNIDVMEHTFDEANLELLSISVKFYSKSSRDILIFFEIASQNFKDGKTIKCIFYDENGEVVDTRETYINEKKFPGYDVKEIRCYSDDEFLDTVQSMRVFVY